MKEADGIQGHVAGKGLVSRAVDLIGSWDRLRDRIRDWPAPLREYIGDLRWSANMRRARRWRRDLNHSQLTRFDAALRQPIVDTPGLGPLFLEYPGAFYYVHPEDVERAILASIETGWDDSISWGNHGKKGSLDDEPITG